MTPDIEIKKTFSSTPELFEVISNTPRCDRFMRKWLSEDDRPAQHGDGRLFLILTSENVEEFLADAVQEGLVFGDDRG
jgi:hypothetical protein